MDTPSSLDISKLLTEANNFSDSDQKEKMRLLAAAVVPYGKVSQKSVPEIYREIETRRGEVATAIMARLMDKAGFRRKFISQLQRTPVCESAHMPLLYFTELLVEISDELGNGEYLRRLKNRIPDSQLGTCRENISTAVQLFQQLLFTQTINLEEEVKSLELVQEWLCDIGRIDISRKVEKEKKRSKLVCMGC